MYVGVLIKDNLLNDLIIIIIIITIIIKSLFIEAIIQGLLSKKVYLFSVWPSD
jgi:hypothetical protein